MALVSVSASVNAQASFCYTVVCFRDCYPSNKPRSLCPAKLTMIKPGSASQTSSSTACSSGELSNVHKYNSRDLFCILIHQSMLGNYRKKMHKQ